MKYSVELFSLLNNYNKYVTMQLIKKINYFKVTEEVDRGGNIKYSA